VAALVLPAEVAKAGEGSVLIGTQQGVVKRIPLEALPAPSARTFSVISLGSGDLLGWARLTSGSDEILLASSSGMVIRFPEQEVRAVGLAAAGVMGMRLEKKEHLVAVDLARREGDLLVVTENGFGKRVPMSQFPVQGRNGKGLRASKAGLVLAGASSGTEEDHAFVHLARAGARSLKFSAAPRRSRAANGSRLVEPGAKDRVILVGSAFPRPAAPAPPPAKPSRKTGRKPGKAKAGQRGTSAKKGAHRKTTAPPKKKSAGKKPKKSKVKSKPRRR
jgi:DNA gyrase subunit A